MTDRELLEFAAKAAGYKLKKWSPTSESTQEFFIAYLPVLGREKEYPDYWTEEFWNPLTDDGDALRLAVKMEMLVHIETCYYTSVWNEKANITEHIGNDGKGCIYAATRRAIVRAAAEIGKTMP